MVTVLLAALVVLVAVAVFLLVAGTWVIAEDESGLVIKKFGAP